MRQFKESDLPVGLSERRDSKTGEKFVKGVEAYNPHDRALILINEHPGAYLDHFLNNRIRIEPHAHRIIPHRQFRLEFEDGSAVPVINIGGVMGNIVINAGHAVGHGIKNPKEYHHPEHSKPFEAEE